MRFEHPNFLFALLLLVVPILIHLFSFRRYKTFYFSSIQFLKNIEEETRNVRKLKHLLVLISRLLVFICLVLTFAQPYLPVKGSIDFEANSTLAIYIDNSFSMSSVGANGSLLSEAKEQAKKFIENAPATTNILLVSNELSGIEQQFCTKSDALNRLDKLSFSPLHHQMSEVLQWMEESIQEKVSQPFTKQLVVLSDFQQNQSDLQNIKLNKSSYFYPIQILPQQQQNVSIDTIWFNEPNFKIKTNNTLNVKLTNHGNEAVENLELQFSINETKRTVFVSIPSKTSKNIALNYSDLTPGEKIGHLQINDKNLPFDNDYYFTYNVNQHTRVLIIQGENATPKISKTYKLDNYYLVNEINSTSFLPESTRDKQLIVLNGVNKLNDGINDALIKFTQTGGSILLFPGTDVATQPWNSLLKKLNLPLIESIKSENLNVTSINYEDPFFQGVFDKKPKKLNLPLVKKIYSTHTTIHATNLINLQNDSPLFVRSGSAYFCTSALDSTFSSFTSNALFPSCLLRTAELSQQKSELSLTIGANTRFPLFTTMNNESVYHIKGEGTDFIPTIEKIDQFTYLSLLGTSNTNTLKQGFYKIESNNFSSSLALNYARNESKIDTYSEAEIKTYLSTDKFPYVFYKNTQLGDRNLNIALEKPTEYWRIFLLLSLLFLFTEMALLKFLR